MAVAQTGSNTISAHRTAKTRFQRLYRCFRGPAVELCCRRCHRKSRYTGNRYGGRPKRDATLSQHIGQLKPKFQRLIHPYFRCRPVQRRCRQHNRKSHYTGNRYNGRPNWKLKLSWFHEIPTHLSEVMQFNVVVDDTTGCRVIPEKDMAGNQTYITCAEMALLPVWAAATCISGIMRKKVRQWNWLL